MMRMSIALACALATALVVSCGGNSGGGGTPDAYTVRCGDGVCDSSEVNSCATDCGMAQQHGASCGNHVCEVGETSVTCPTDCGSGSGSGSAVCGDGICETGEDINSCPSDCGSGSGSGALCADPNAPFECILCEIDATMCTGDVTPANCAACGF